MTEDDARNLQKACGDMMLTGTGAYKIDPDGAIEHVCLSDLTDVFRNFTWQTVDPRITDKPLASLGVARRITNGLKAAAQQPDENGMIEIPAHSNSPLAMGDPVAVPLYDDARMPETETAQDDAAYQRFCAAFREPAAPVVTEEMIAAVEQELKVREGCPIDNHYWAEKICRVALSMAPVPLVTEAEDALVRALEERDLARRENARLHDALKVRTDERDALERERAVLTKELARLNKHICGLDTLLAQRPAPVSDAPKAQPNPFRDFNHDPRRIGG